MGAGVKGSTWNGPDFRNAAAVAAAIRRAQELLRPPPDIKPSEWAEASVKIPAGNALPGPMRMANAPYQREPMDSLVDPDVTRETLMWGAQVGKTMTALCVQGFCIEVQPRSQMMMQPSQGDLTTWLETKFQPMVDANPSLIRRIAKPRGREGVNNQRMKSYPGGFMMFAWSGSPRTMRGRSAPVIVCDEVDGYERTDEGHPVGLLWQRAATFGDQRFLFEISTPTVKGGYIDLAFQAGDQRRFYVACPECGEHQHLKWENVTWPGRRSTGIEDADEDLKHDEHDPAGARYACECCGALWDDGQRIAAIRTAEEIGAGWKAAKPFKGHISRHINEFYSTFRRLRDIVQSYLDRLAQDDLQTFVNVSLSLPYDLNGERADPDSLLARREVYAAQVPAGGLYITAGIDMQMDRLEVEIVAWGFGDESWSLDYRVLWGDPLQGDVWSDLDDLLAETFMHESGTRLPISAACLDTGGTNGYTQAAYDYARGKTGRRLFAIKGIPGWGRPIVEKPQRKQSGKNARKVDLFQVGVDEAKLVTMRRLAKGKPGPGYCHFPLNDDTHGKGYFDGLTAEKMVVRYVKGQPVREWHKPDRARNEPFDCRNYALAALKIMQPSFKRLAERLKVTGDALPGALVKLAKTLQAAREATENPQEEETQPTPETKPIRRSKSLTRNKRPGGRGFVKNW